MTKEQLEIKFRELVGIADCILEECVDSDSEVIDELAEFLYDENGNERYPEDEPLLGTPFSDNPN
jgi:hypothetical protein